MKGSDPDAASAAVLTPARGSDPFPWERPLGAVPGGDGRTSFRVWAPRAKSLALRLRGEYVELADQGFGVYAAEAEADHGDDYSYVVDGSELPDPCSRWQPQGLRGPSRVFDPGSIEWTPFERSGELVVYQLHIGTFSREGTFDAAIPHLSGLAELGVTAIEIMPVAEFPGARGW